MPEAALLKHSTGAKKEGKAPFVGFTGHKEPAFHLDMLDRGYPFDRSRCP